MEKVFFGLLLFCVTIASGSGLVELEAKSKVLVEGQDATFECRYSGEQKKANLSWHLISSRFRHPVSNISVPLFEAPSGGPHFVSAGPFRFHLAPRRDFEGNWLVCNSSDGGEAKLTFGRIEKTIGIDVIMPNHTFLVMKNRPAGSTETIFCCIVKAPFNGTAEMLIYMLDDKSFPLKSAGNGMFCHKMQFNPAADFWTFMSCVARSTIGTVYSQMGEALFFNPTFRPLQSEFFNKTVIITVCYSDLHLPISNDAFQIFQFDDNKQPSKKVKVVNVALSTDGQMTWTWNKKEKKKTYIDINAKITIAPDSIGMFQLFFAVSEHNKIYTRHGPTFGIYKHFAEISEEKLEDSKVTLGAFARLYFKLRASVEPRKDDVSVEGPSGLPLPPQDFHFTFDRNSQAAKLEFVVRSAGRYQVVIRLPQVVENGSQHQIETESPELSSSLTPEKVLFDCNVVVPVTYLGRQPPAFPNRAFQILKSDESGETVWTDIVVSNVSMIRTGNRKFSANVTFSPRCPGLFQMMLKNQKGLRIVLVKNNSTSQEPAMESNAYGGITFGFIIAIFVLVLHGKVTDILNFIQEAKASANRLNLVNWLRQKISEDETNGSREEIPLMSDTTESGYVSFFMECKWGFKFLLKLKREKDEVAGSQLKAAIKNFFGDVKLGQRSTSSNGITFVETAFDGKFVSADGKELSGAVDDLATEIPDSEMVIPQKKKLWIKITRDDFTGFPTFEGIDEQIRNDHDKDYSWIIQI